MKNNAHLAERLSVLSLREAVAILRERPHLTDRAIAEAVPEISRRSVNHLRRIATDTPQHLPAVLSGELSLQQAVLLRRGMRAKQKLTARVTDYSEVRWRLPIDLIEQVNNRAQLENLTPVELLVKIMSRELSK
jgi:hypothetical protein